MAQQLFKNNAKSTLNGTLAVGNTTINLPSGHGNRFPSISAGDYFLLTLYEKDGSANEITYEIVKVTARTGDTLTVSRDYEGLVVGAGGTSGGWAFPSAPAVNPSQVVYIDLRYTAYAAENTLNKDANLAGLGSASTARTNLGLGSIATQNSNNVTITGGTISGVTLDDSTTIFADNLDNTKKLQFQLSTIGTGLTRTVTFPNTDITLPGVNVANTWAAAQTFSSTINKVTVTPPATGSTLTIADGKTLTASNTLTLSGTDSSTLNIGTGGTLGSAAYTASSAYATSAQGTLATNALPSASFTDAAVTGKLITGFSSGAGTVAATDTILQAFNKVVGNIAAKANIASPTFTGTSTFVGVKDTVYSLTGLDINPANGAIQLKDLGSSVTLTATNFEAGQVVLLGINDGTAYTVTWPTVQWIKAGGSASAPTLGTSEYTWVLLWKTGVTLFATLVGTA